ncbi:MAG: hypothetical protein HY074_19150 [Deltaproteobacteria bacterium]|nr:hypothetical protein [Deltaproteobacteria bacterium]
MTGGTGFSRRSFLKNGYEKCKTDTTPDPELARRILATNRDFFWGSAPISGATRAVNRS